jgi:hypothetical protein
MDDDLSLRTSIITNKDFGAVMITRIAEVLLISALFVFASTAANADPPRFVSAGEADLLILTHSSLRTQSWMPGMPNAWETELLDQKSGQCFSVAIHDVSDENNENQFSIKQWINSSASQIRFLMIIGDARRPNGDNTCTGWWNPTANPLFYPSVDATSGNFVPSWSFPEYLGGARWGVNGWDWTINDNGYVSDLANYLVGRLPASSMSEIRNYISKTNLSLSLPPHQTWTNRVLFAGDDLYFAYNGVPGQWTLGWEGIWERRLSSAWTNSSLHTSDYNGPNDEPVRHALLESRFNDGQGIVTFYGPRSAAWQLANWYTAGSQYADYDFAESVNHVVMAVHPCCR